MKTRLEFMFALVTAAVSVVTAGLVAYWLLFDTELPLKDTSVVLLDVSGKPAQHFHAGDVVLVQRKSCVRDDGPALYTRTIVGADGETYYAQSSTVQFNNDGCRTAYNEIELPKHLRPGAYRYIVTVHFQTNPLLAVTQALPVATFVIDPKESK